MPVRIKNASLNNPVNTGDDGPEFVEIPFENRVTVVDGQEVHWAQNQVRSFSDEGVGIAHTAFTSGSSIVQDDRPFDALT